MLANWRRMTKVGVLWCLLPLSALADQLIIEPDMGPQPIVHMMQSAQHSLDLVMYGFTEKNLLNALAQQKARGRTVKVILERTPFRASDENQQAIATFNQQRITWQPTMQPFRFIHQKTLIVDDREALVMTFNFTKSTFKNQRNFGLITDNPNEVREIANVFNADWNHAPALHSSTNLFWSPDDSREKMLHHINRARKTVNIYSQNINDYAIVGALAALAKRGIDVNILTSGKIPEKKLHYLKKAGVNIHFNKKMYIHAKVFIIDDKEAIIGSINLTRNSLDENRELSIVTYDAKVVRQLNNTFNADWNM